MIKTNVSAKSLKYAYLLVVFLIVACKSEKKSIKPVRQSITESVYASGLIKSKNQYQVFATVSGIIDQVYADEGTAVAVGSPLLSIINEAQQLTADNAKLSADYNALVFNKGKLDDAKTFVDLTKSQMSNALAMLSRQQSLWSQNIGTKIDLEQKELASIQSKSNYESAKEKLKELERQLSYLSSQAKNNLLISKKNTGDFLLKSKIKGRVYQMNLKKGEIVTPQTPIAIVGDDTHFLLEMQIDEYDIVSIKLGMPVLVVLNSYRGLVFNAVVTKVYPIMNLQSKTFTIEAEFIDAPKVLYPNISFEANVVLRTKKDALLIPRPYLLNDSIVINKAGKKIIVKTGLKDYQMIEILSGINENEELILPEL